MLELVPDRPGPDLRYSIQCSKVQRLGWKPQVGFEEGLEKTIEGDEALRKITESGDDISTTAINFHEITYGLQKYAKATKEALELPVLNYTKEDAHLSAKLELEAERTGAATRRTDAMIAAIAINNGAKLYTFDLKHFRAMKAQGLRFFQ
jgi:predicted nucleic acid-binding protein